MLYFIIESCTDCRDFQLVSSMPFEGSKKARFERVAQMPCDLCLLVSSGNSLSLEGKGRGEGASFRDYTRCWPLSHQMEEGFLILGQAPG